MWISDLIYLYLWQVFRHIEDNQIVWISAIIAYVTTRPFNMKWQEFQELISYPLNKALNGNEIYSELWIKIESPADKQKTDLFLSTNKEKYKFSIKNYTTTRFQVSTMAKKLMKYEWRLSGCPHDSGIILEDKLQNEIIDDIKQDLSDDITIFALTNRKKDNIDIYLLSLKETFLDNIDYMKAEYADRDKTPHWRIRFLFKWHDKHLFSLDLWKNALNRWVWWENRRLIIWDNNLRKTIFYSLLDVSKKDLKPFLAIDQNLKNKAIIKIIEEGIKNHKAPIISIS